VEQLLDRKKKRAVMVYWLPILTGVAALLLLFVGWWALMKNKPANHGDTTQPIVKTSFKKDTGISGGATRQQVVHQNIALIVTSWGGSKRVKKARNGIDSYSKPYADGARRADTGLIDQRPEERVALTTLAAASEQQKIDLLPLDAQPVNSGVLNTPAVEDKGGVSTNKLKIKQQSSFRPRYAISVVAAPDINGVGSSFAQGKVGTNVGLMFSAGISKKLTISTGALYSAKSYITGFTDYHTAYQFQTNPVSVLADCRMIDIPLNISYQVYHRQQNKISLGTGLSSYLMLHENYNFNYANASATNPVSYDVRTPQKYFFGVMNINATYERQVSSKVGISLQPYVKLPLTNIGYSQVKLQTTGIALGLTWNLNSLSKP
ncbi:MAG: hypothetical protein ABI203_07875, partial [Mucilaginibacter sp.]